MCKNVPGCLLTNAREDWVTIQPDDLNACILYSSCDPVSNSPDINPNSFKTQVAQATIHIGKGGPAEPGEFNKS